VAFLLALFSFLVSSGPPPHHSPFRFFSLQASNLIPLPDEENPTLLAERLIISSDEGASKTEKKLPQSVC
jgi:hypothetical protein